MCVGHDASFNLLTPKPDSFEWTYKLRFVLGNIMYAWIWMQEIVHIWGNLGEVDCGVGGSYLGFVLEPRNNHPGARIT